MKTCKEGGGAHFCNPTTMVCEWCGLHWKDLLDSDLRFQGAPTSVTVEPTYPPVRKGERICSCVYLSTGRTCNYPVVKRQDGNTTVWCNPDGTRHMHQGPVQEVDTVQPEVKASSEVHGIDLAKGIIDDRAGRHGPFVPANEALGKVWAGILSSSGQPTEPLSARTVLLMLAAMKVCRASQPFKFVQDDYVDGHGYLHLAEQCPKGEPK